MTRDDRQFETPEDLRAVEQALRGVRLLPPEVDGESVSSASANTPRAASSDAVSRRAPIRTLAGTWLNGLLVGVAVAVFAMGAGREDAAPDVASTGEQPAEAVNDAPTVAPEADVAPKEEASLDRPYGFAGIESLGMRSRPISYVALGAARVEDRPFAMRHDGEDFAPIQWETSDAEAPPVYRALDRSRVIEDLFGDARGCDL